MFVSDIRSLEVPLERGVQCFSVQLVCGSRDGIKQAIDVQKRTLKTKPCSNITPCEDCAQEGIDLLTL